MSVLATGVFWAATGERAVKTAAQFAISILTVAGVTPVDIDWQQVAAGSGLAALISVLMSVASAGVGNPGPSLTSEQLTPAPPVPVVPPTPEG